MADIASPALMPDRIKDRLAALVVAHGPRLAAFVRRRVSDLAEAEDIVQDVLSELVAAERLIAPIENVAAWLAQVARNRIVDRYRARGRRAAIVDPAAAYDDADAAPDERLLGERIAPAGEGPESVYERAALVDALAAALEELPPEQREVFVAHELDGRSFKEIAVATGVGLNTLLGRKHAAVRHLRRRLDGIRSTFDS